MGLSELERLQFAGFPSTRKSLPPARTMIAPSDTSLPPIFAIWANGRPQQPSPVRCGA